MRGESAKEKGEHKAGAAADATSSPARRNQAAEALGELLVQARRLTLPLIMLVVVSLLVGAGGAGPTPKTVFVSLFVAAGGN